MVDAELLARLAAVLTFQAGYNSAVVMIGATLLGIAAGVVGSFIFLRGRALISDALSHATLPGIVLAFLVGAALGLETRSLALLLAGAAITGALGVWLVQVMTRYTRLGEDAAIGAVLSVFFGLGVALLSYVQTLPVGGQAGIKSFILGQVAAMSRGEATVIAVLALVAVLATALMFKEFRLVCFDPAFAQGTGWPVFRIDLVMAGLTVLVTVTGLQTVGLVLIIALLIVPPVAARFWSNRLSRIVVLAGTFGALSAYLGAALSSIAPGLPAGGLIVLVAGVVFLASLLFAPRRGVLAQLLRQALFGLRLRRERALAALAARAGTPVPAGLRRWLRLSGLLDAEGALTPRGRARAAHAARNLRLWETALVAEPAAVPRRAVFGIDPIERLLPADSLARIEALAAPAAPRRPA